MATWIEPGEATALAFAHPAVPLRNLISRQKRPIDKSKSTLAELQLIAKITFGGELVLRTDEEKRGYKGPLFEARPDELIISKIRVGQGSFCVVPAIGPIAVSPEYPVYALDKNRIQPDFVARVLRTPSFTRALTQAKSGNTTKQRIRPAFFESQVVPLPSLDRQREIMAAHDALIAQAAALDAQAEQAEADALAAFEKALGYGPPPPLPDRPIFIAHFSELESWGHEAILRGSLVRTTGATSGPPRVALGSLVSAFQVGWSPRCLDRAAEANEWGVLKLNAVSGGRFDGSANKALPSSLSPKPELEVRSGDVLIIRGSGVTRVVGAAVYVEAVRPRLMLCDLIFRPRFREGAPVRPRFLAEVLRIGEIRREIERRRTGAAPMLQKITASALESLVIPLPPVDAQDAMIAALDAARAEAARLRAKAAALRDRAARDFEEAVYGPTAVEAVAAPAA